VPASPLRNVLGQNLKRAREECGLSQRALTALSGVSQRHIALIETVGVNVSLDVIAALASQVDRTVAELLTPPAS
jgi:transcriptional regulator with XRE-family HTH domain